MNKVLVTGGTGFVGRAVVDLLRQRGQPVVLAVRGDDITTDRIGIGDMDGRCDWARALDGCSSVIHLAGQTPGRQATVDSLHRINADATARLVEQAKVAGVQQVTFVSSVFTIVDQASPTPVTDATATRCTLAYGRSKLAAEAAVASFASAERTAVSLRPPLVHGPLARGNWLALMKLAASGLPLPFAAVENRRSLISLANLADAILICAERAKPRDSGAYVIADKEVFSLARMVRLLRQGMGKPEGLVSVPPGLLHWGLDLIGRRQMARSLLDDLEIDSQRFRAGFAWQPPEDGENAIRSCGAAFAQMRGAG